jgi:hypothetical protein
MDHDHFLPHTFKSVIHNHTTGWCYNVCSWKSVSIVNESNNQSRGLVLCHVLVNNPAYTQDRHNTDYLLWRNTTITGIYSKILINRNILLLSTKHFLNTSVLTLTGQSNTGEAFPLKCWSPSDDGHHWPKHIKPPFYYYKTLLYLMEFNPNFTYMLQSARADANVS